MTVKQLLIFAGATGWVAVLRQGPGVAVAFVAYKMIDSGSVHIDLNTLPASGWASILAIVATVSGAGVVADRFRGRPPK